MLSGKCRHRAGRGCRQRCLAKCVTAATPLVPRARANSPNINPQNGNLVYEITRPPLNTRMTYVYDANNHVRRKQDPSGRISTFSVPAASRQLSRILWWQDNLWKLLSHSNMYMTMYLPECEITF